MAYDVTALDNAGLKNVIDNHRAKKRTGESVYLVALEEWERRKGGGLDFDKSLAIIRQAAQERRFLCYKDLADESGVDWNRAHYAVNEHVGHLIEYAHLRGWPMLSAIIVNKHNQATGQMEPYTLKGFLNAARELGREVLDEDTFLQKEQERVFEWAASGPVESAEAASR